jgi:hypothetical protein
VNALAFVLALSMSGGLAPASAVDFSLPSSTRTQGLLALTGGVAFGVTSLTAFTAGLDVERQMRGGPLPREELDDLMATRATMAWIAWPSLVVSLAGIGAGVALLNVPEEGAP